MKNKVIAVLVDTEMSQEQKYNQLVRFYGEGMNFMQARHFQTGYSDAKMEKLEYEVKKHFQISDTEIHEFQPEDEVPVIQTNELKTIPLGDNANPSDLKIVLNEGTTLNPAAGAQNETQISEQQKQILDAIEQNSAAKEGLKIRDQYLFLNDPACPDEFKILVADKITAWKEFAKSHGLLVIGIDDNEKEETLYELAKSAVYNFQLNDDIRKELDFYREQGKVLGENPKLSNLKIKEEIYELSEAGLVEMKSKATKNISKAKKEMENQGTNENREKRFADWTLREKLASERLNEEFKK